MGLRSIYKIRRATVAIVLSIIVSLVVLANPNAYQRKPVNTDQKTSEDTQNLKNKSDEQKLLLAREVLEKLEVKGRAPKTGYKRTEFYNGWPEIDGCNLRQRILKRDFGETAKLDDKCNVVAGKFYEPYTGEEMEFNNRAEISKKYRLIMWWHCLMPGRKEHNIKQRTNVLKLRQTL